MDWRVSKAHRAAFIRLPRRIDGPLKTDLLNDYWTPKLGEPVTDAVSRWFEEGHYRQCQLLETLALILTVPALKTMLKERSLKVGGNKSEMLNRVMEADAAALQIYAQRFPIWMLTERAQVLQNEFRAEAMHEYAIARQQIESRLRMGDFCGACDEWERYDCGQVFSVTERALGFNTQAQWRQSCLEDLKRIFASGATPAAIGLGISRMFGEPPSGLEQRSLNTAVAFARDVESFRSADYVIGVQIHMSPTGNCSACNEVIGYWRKTSVPIMPHPGCRKEGGCLCFWTAIFKDDQLSGPWRG